MDNITNLSLSCEDKAVKIAENFHNMAKQFEAMKIMDGIRKEMPLLTDIATEGIRKELQKKQPDISQIIYELKMTIQDGYRELSLNLSNAILNF